MTDNKSKSMFSLFNNYTPVDDPPTSVIEEKLESLDAKVKRLEDKIDKLIESNRCMVQYFSSQSVRELNHNLRSYASKHTPPVNFVPTKRGLI